MCDCDKNSKTPCPNKENHHYIQVTEKGPYLVFGEEEVVQEVIVPDEEGASAEYQRAQVFKKPAEHEKCMALCRCGQSKNKPFCDGSHEKADWDSHETASFAPILEKAEAIEGPNLTLMDNEAYCAFARFCDAKGRVWNLVQEGTPEADAQAILETHACPAGRLMIKRNQDGKFIEPKLEPEISILEDPVAKCSGPIYVKGGMEIKNAHGKSYEIRNRQTLCRCGKSSNKPFCDGSHASTDGA